MNTHSRKYYDTIKVTAKVVSSRSTWSGVATWNLITELAVEEEIDILSTASSSLRKELRRRGVSDQEIDRAITKLYEE